MVQLEQCKICTGTGCTDYSSVHDRDQALGPRHMIGVSRAQRGYPVVDQQPQTKNGHQCAGITGIIHHVIPASHTVATTFSSIAIGVGRQLISNVVRQGGSFSKYSFHSRL